MAILNANPFGKNLMNLHQAARRTLVLALVMSFTLSGLIPPAQAQTQSRSRRPSVQEQTPPRRQMRGTEHRRPQRTYDVQHYTIRTRFDVPNKTVYGDTTVMLRPLASGFLSFDLDATGMEFESVKLEPDGKALRWTQAPNKLSITLDRSYTASDTVAVRIRYRTTPEKGLYFVPASPATRYRRYTKPAQIWTQGEPEENHFWFPCYDFPDDKATSEQYITTGANETAISNGELLETTNNPDGTRTFHWKMEQPHSSYLISMVVGNYVKLTDSYRNIPIEYYTYPGTEAKARAAFGRTPQMMQFFSDRFQFGFPFNKYAQTIVANFIFGGMENITATTQADTEILSGPDDEPSDGADNLVSHELSHSWFGNIATAKDWANLWVNEGFATFFEAAYKEHAAGRDAYMEEMDGNASAYFSEDSYQYRRPIVSNRYLKPVDLFDATLYKKGGVVVHMLREVVGDDVFWKALNAYLNEFKYQNTEARDVQRVFERVSGKNLDWFFDQWLYKAGYPELRVRQSYNPQTRQLALDVEQTQTPDALTPSVFRLPGIEIEIGTTRGRKTERIDVTKRSERFTFTLDSRPRMVVFDKGQRVLKKLDFPQPGEMTVFQLRHSTDAIARKAAAERLAEMEDASLLEDERRETVEALRQALAHDSFYGVRAAAADALTRFRSDAAMSSALLEATKDKDSRVRSVAIKGIRELKTVEEAESPTLKLVFLILFGEGKEAEAES
ncbi:MAG TPA: M1 family aminopeptidase [Pyrinomonadaceae bacterium]|jgi:aminopeptidase N